MYANFQINRTIFQRLDPTLLRKLCTRFQGKIVKSQPKFDQKMHFFFKFCQIKFYISINSIDLHNYVHLQHNWPSNGSKMAIFWPNFSKNPLYNYIGKWGTQRYTPLTFCPVTFDPLNIFSKIPRGMGHWGVLPAAFDPLNIFKKVRPFWKLKRQLYNIMPK